MLIAESILRQIYLEIYGAEYPRGARALAECPPHVEPDRWAVGDVKASLQTEYSRARGRADLQRNVAHMENLEARRRRWKRFHERCRDASVLQSEQQLRAQRATHQARQRATNQAPGAKHA